MTGVDASRGPRTSAASRLRIVVTGLIAQHPLLGGVTWDYLQYVVGLARLGHDVYYIEDSGEWPYNSDGGASGNDWVADDCTRNVESLAGVMARFDLSDRWAYRFPLESRWFGLSDVKRRTILESADLLINVSGTLEHPEEYRRIPRLAYIDSDPGFTQVRLAGGQAEFERRVAAHDVHLSFGECPSSEVIPPTAYRWLPTRQPVVLSEWRPSTPRRDVFTTVMSWTSYKPLVHAGQTYGQKDVEFRRFLGLPRKVTPCVLEVALGRTQHVTWQTDDGDLPAEIAQVLVERSEWRPRDLLSRTGWLVADATEACADLDSYRHYVQSSMAEWSVAKHGYVVGQSGWFSCRSACYLAAGRPVVVQDTGFGPVLPTGEGILRFRTVEEAVEAIRDVSAHYARHAKAARQLAEEYFDSDTVLTRLIDQCSGGRLVPPGGPGQ
jgi:hypothetical protein